jgi:hypothetical protein
MRYSAWGCRSQLDIIPPRGLSSRLNHTSKQYHEPGDQGLLGLVVGIVTGIFFGDMAAQVESMFEEDLRHSEPVRQGKLAKISFWFRLAVRLRSRGPPSRDRSTRGRWHCESPPIAIGLIAPLLMGFVLGRAVHESPAAVSRCRH